MDVSNIEILFVDTDDALRTLAEKLKGRTAFSFDTEFDRFWREYGFKLLLIQIYADEICYLIDPLAIKDLKPLWAVFEDEKICKIAYACSEDIQLLKIHGCHTKNIFDVQVAAKICNHTGNSFGDLVLDLCNASIDKSLQRSNWRTRPLSKAQQIYASNDVVWLPHLHHHFFTLAKENGTSYILQIENKDCENVTVTEYEVKLSPKQHARYTHYYKQVLFKLFMLRNDIAKDYNLPPFMICTDATLEEIIENSILFLEKPFEKGFASKFKQDEKNKILFLEIVKSIDVAIPFLAIKKPKTDFGERKITAYPDRDIVEKNCKKIQQVVTEKYGVTAGEFILRGLKKSLLVKPYQEINLKSYQFEIIDKVCSELAIVL